MAVPVHFALLKLNPAVKSCHWSVPAILLMCLLRNTIARIQMMWTRAHVPLLRVHLPGGAEQLLSSLPAEEYQPAIAPASADAALALHRFRVPEGWKAELVAAEPQLANPVAFCFDEQGHIYVAEMFRQSKGVNQHAK